MMEEINLKLEIIEAPKGIFCADIVNVLGAIAQGKTKHEAIAQAFLMAEFSMRIDKRNFKNL